jgi:hypothetical protein
MTLVELKLECFDNHRSVALVFAWDGGVVNAALIFGWGTDADEDFFDAIGLFDDLKMQGRFMGRWTLRGSGKRFFYKIP